MLSHIGGSDSSVSFTDAFVQITKEHRERKDKLRRELIAAGVAAAHPNDGWVRRNEDGVPLSVYLSYPLFNRGGIVEGDMIALYKTDYSYSLWTVHAIVQGILGSVSYRLAAMK
jgi:hypothetical protein